MTPTGQKTGSSSRRPPARQLKKAVSKQPEPLTVDEIVGEKKPAATVFSRPSSSAGTAPRPRFNGVVDDRVIPDAGVPTEYMEGVLDQMGDGHGFLRPKFSPSNRDVYISGSQIRRFSLRPGDMVGGQVRSPKENERYYGILKVEKVNGVEIEKLKTRANFSDLVPVYPNQLIKLETEKDILTTRIIDLVAPIGRGQRGLLVSPPKAGKTWLLKDIANGITQNFKNIHLMAVLVGERPEEVTDISRSVKGEVMASNFDEPPEHQTRVAEIALDRAKRLVEMGRDVVILLDSITRLARAYNLCIPTSGRTLTGGFDPAALYPPKRFFGAARNIENDGSLTIIGTTLVDTGSKMDDLIYEEFKGTGNMELHLDRHLAERRVFPAIDIQRSGTRQEQLLYDPKYYPQIVVMRKMVDLLGKDERTALFLEQLKKTKNNEEFLKNLNRA
ncbi:MAG: transcription termination factor Rho [Candidatus Pacebacteria bacterium]|nr:transcription termination factor Rho [Candidatus Paceibacterota bacterium]